MAAVVLVPVGTVPEDLLLILADRLAAGSGLGTRIAARALDPRPAFDRVRKQYSSTRLLELLAATSEGSGEERILGVIDADLFVPVLTFVFGEAELGGHAAVMSLTRLRPTYYGLPEDPGLCFERILKEALHEIGHTFGLRHCRHPACVMRASTNAGQVDLKPSRYCEECVRAVR